MELIDIFDENNNYLGYSLERSKVHKENFWHHHVSAEELEEIRKKDDKNYTFCNWDEAGFNK